MVRDETDRETTLHGEGRGGIIVMRPSCKTEVTRNSFFLRVVSRRDSLTLRLAVKAGSLDIFE